MPIIFDETHRIFHLQAGDTSYAFQLHPTGHLVHLYWGSRLRSSNIGHLARIQGRAFSASPEPGDPDFSLDTLPQEYPSYGTSDFRAPAFQVHQADGSTISNVRYLSHRIVNGKPPLAALPSTYVEEESEATTLEITLADPVTSLNVILTYTAFESFNVITRSARFVNAGEATVRLLRAFSTNVDFSHDRYTLLQLSGAWSKERFIELRSLTSGTHSIESRRGASSPQQNPFLALMSKDATEHTGEVYGFSLVYSGNFLASVEVDQYRTARLGMGINPFDFTWVLEPGETFQTPEVVHVFASDGLNGMSQTYHALYRTRLCRGLHRDKVRPILVNNWEATYFDFTAEKIEALAKVGSDLGIELFVLDDGWFGKRNDDRSSLGDWFVNSEKLPEGLEGVAERVRQAGLQFGLWVEPEMISPDSELYRSHPDWCLHVPKRHSTESRNQLLLDFSRQDVCDAIIEMISQAISSAPISYIKWDMNRHITEAGSAQLSPERQRETAHRYILGLYRVMEVLTTRFPEVLFESCSGGGGRFDPGMLYYMPQTWTSDNTDAISRLFIQYGTSVVYPVSSMGAHVSAVPNHQVHRRTPLEIRGHVAMSGNLGYELDLTGLSPEERDEVRSQVDQYKGLRRLIQFGRFYRLLSPFEGNVTAWMFVSDDRKEALAAWFRILAPANAHLERLRLVGLDASLDYKLESTGQFHGGDELMHAGINIPLLEGDFQSVLLHLKEIDT